MLVCSARGTAVGFRFYKSVSVGRGLRMSVSKSGVGLSLVILSAVEATT
jgi:hypothetical protein